MKVAVFPKITSKQDADIIQPLCEWYLPAFAKKSDVLVWRDPDYVPENRWDASLYQPNSQVPMAKDLGAADLVLYWKGEDFEAAPNRLRRKGMCVDPYSASSWEDHLCKRLTDMQTGEAALSERAFRRWFADHGNSAEALIIGPGPSQAVDLEPLGSQKFITFYMGAALFDEALRSRFPPNFIIAADGPSQFSQTATARRFQKMACDIMRETGAFMIIPSIYVSIIKTHWPKDIQLNCLGVPAVSALPVPYKLGAPWGYEPTANILTSLALPCAHAASNTINFAGISFEKPKTKQEPKAIWDYANLRTGLRIRADVMQNFPLSGWTRADYQAQHYARLGAWTSGISERGGKVRQGGKAVEHAKSRTYNPDRFRPLRENAYSFLVRCEQNPGLPLFLLFIIGTTMTALIDTFFGETWLLIFLGGIIFSAVFGLYLYAKRRMNVRLAALERRLNLTQTRHFENVSARIASLEDQQN